MQLNSQQSTYNDLRSTLSDHLHTLADGYHAGKITAEGFGFKMQDALEHAHGEAAYLGRHAAGDHTEFDKDDAEWGRIAAGKQQPFVDGLVSDLDAGKYEGKEGDLNDRLDMYADGLVGTANETWAIMQDGTIDWQAEPDCCDDCNGYEAGSPYSPDELPTYPGAGDSACLSNCRCSLVSSGGDSGFVNPED